MTGRIIGQIVQPFDETSNLTILFPGWRSDMPDIADVRSMTPTYDCNEEVLAYCATYPGQWPASVYVGLFGADPFRRPRDLLLTLRRLGVRRIANFPSLGIFEEQSGNRFAQIGFETKQEYEFLSDALHEGMDVLAFVFNEEQAEYAKSLGIEQLCVHPGLAVSDATLIRRAVAETESLLRSLCKSRRGDSHRTLLYVPHGLTGDLEALFGLADELILGTGFDS